jgi:hypothetical protein
MRLASTYGVYSLRSNDMRHSLVNLVSQCTIYVSENVRDHGLFFKHAAAPFVAKLDGFAAERLVADFNERMDELMPDDESSEIHQFLKHLEQVAKKGGRSGYAKKSTKQADKSVAEKASPKRKLDETESSKPNKKKKVASSPEKVITEEQRSDEEKEESQKEQEESEQEQSEELISKPAKRGRPAGKRVGATEPIKSVNVPKKAQSRVSATSALKVSTKRKSDETGSGTSEDESPKKKQKKNGPAQNELTEDEMSVPRRKKSQRLSQSSQESPKKMKKARK